MTASPGEAIDYGRFAERLAPVYRDGDDRLVPPEQVPAALRPPPERNEA